jgi:hypothetical protein
MLKVNLTVDELVDLSRLKLFEFIEQIGLTKPTWYRRLEAPETFTVGEVKKITEVVNKGLTRDQALLTTSMVLEIILNHSNSNENSKSQVPKS